MVFDPRTPGIVPEPEDERSNADKVLDLLFGAPTPPGQEPVLQAAIPNPRMLIPQLLNMARSANLGIGKAASKIPGIGNLFRAGGKAVQNPVTGKFTPNASLTQGAKSAVQGVSGALSKVIPSAGTLGKVGGGAVAAGAFIPGVKEGIGAGVAGALSRAGIGASEEEREEAEKKVNSQREIPGLPSIRQEVVDAVSTDSGMEIVRGQPSESRAEDLQIQANRQQAADEVAVDIARGIEQRKELTAGTAQRKLDLQAELDAIKGQAPIDNGNQEFSQRLAALLGAGLPSALTGHGRGVEIGAQMGQQISGEFAQQRAQRQQRIASLEKNISDLNKQHFDEIGKTIDSQTKLAKEIRDGSKELRSINDKTRELEKSGELDPTQRIRVGNTNFKNLGVSMKGEKFFRAEGAPEMTTDSKKKLGGFVNAQPVIDSELDKIRQVVSNVGAESDAALSGPSFYLDKNGKRVEIENAAAFLKTTGTNFKALVKEFRTLGALGQDVIDFTNGLVEDPVGFMQVWRDSSGGIESGVRTQVDALKKAQEEEFQVFKENNQIKGLSEVNADLVRSGELNGFSALPSAQVVPEHPDRVFKFVNPEGRVFLLNQQELNEILKNGRTKRRN